MFHISFLLEDVIKRNSNTKHFFKTSSQQIYRQQDCVVIWHFFVIFSIMETCNCGYCNCGLMVINNQGLQITTNYNQNSEMQEKGFEK